MTKPLRLFLIWILPITMMIGQFISELVVPDVDKPAFFSEGGPHEKIQAVIMWIAVVLAAQLFLLVKGPWLKAWYGVAFLGCLFIAGEEISWGQTYLHWATPDSWGLINDQDETNFHNTSDWLDQKPKILLQIGVLVGGLIIPALQKWKPESLPDKYAEIYPDKQVVVAASFALFVKIVDTIQDIVHRHMFWRASEVLETYIYYFVFMYLVVMLTKEKAKKKI